MVANIEVVFVDERDSRILIGVVAVRIVKGELAIQGAYKKTAS